MNEIKVLDLGFVRLEAFAGGDQAVLRSARVSYGSTSTDSEKDKRLIKFLLTNDHGSPFEHTFFTFHMKLPIFCARQIIRHRVGVAFNEVSARYTEMKEEFYTPTKFRVQDTKNKQGSLNSKTLRHSYLNHKIESANYEASLAYRLLLDEGVAREMARMVLPLNLYTEWYLSMNARSLMHLIGLRSDVHAQEETRQYSHAMARLFAEQMPWTFEAFVDSLRSKKNRDYSELWDFLGYGIDPVTAEVVK